MRQHFEKVGSREYVAATHLSEAARPLLAGVGSDIRQRLIDVFGGTVIDARNPAYDAAAFQLRRNNNVWGGIFTGFEDLNGQFLRACGLRRGQPDN